MTNILPRTVWHEVQNSTDISMNTGDHKLFDSIKTNTCKKLTKEEKLEGIFRIYNRKDMIAKLYSLRKNNNHEKIRVSQFPHTEVDENSYNDYESSSNYLTKLEGRSRKMNRSIYYQKNRNIYSSELAEVDPHLEATPINKNIDNNEDIIVPKEIKSDDSMTSFRGAWLIQEQRTPSKNTKISSSYSSKPRRALQSYVKRDNFTDMKFTPLRSKNPMFNDHNRRYDSNEKHDLENIAEEKCNVTKFLTQSEQKSNKGKIILNNSIGFEYADRPTGSKQVSLKSSVDKSMIVHVGYTNF